MFVVFKKKEPKPKKDSKINIKTPQKSNIITQLSSSPLKTQEKSPLFTNSFTFCTNNSFDSGKGLNNLIQNDYTALNTSTKKDFLSKKTKFHIELVDKEKEQFNVLNEIYSSNAKKKKKIKIISSSEDDVNEGRWDPNEHMKFIEAINNYGNEWKEVQKYVGTRSCNQVRSHAQKFFLKLKTFKDSSLGIDFTVESIKNLSEIINTIKEYEKENKCVNMLSILNQKISDRNIKNENGILNLNENENVLVHNNKIIINNESINENNNNNSKEFIVENTKKKIFKNIKENKNEKKIVKFNKIKKTKINIIKDSNLENKNDNIINEPKNENIVEENNKLKNEDIYSEYDNNNKNNTFGDIYYDNSNQFECETNDKNFYSNFIKEENTISLMNRFYYS